MQLIKLAVCALAGALAAASDGDESGGGGPLRASPAYPSFLQDQEQGGEDFAPCRATQNMCDSCSRDCGCKTGRCSWNYVCYDKKDMKGANGCTCKRDPECKSGRCDKYFTCQNKVGNGGGCLEDEDCAKGRCDKYFTCRDKVGRGGGCLEDDDCAENNCVGNIGNRRCDCARANGCGCFNDGECDSGHCDYMGLSFDWKCQPPCTLLPFMVTNIVLSDAGSEKRWDYHSSSTPTGFRFLKDIRFCPQEFLGLPTKEFDIFGTEVSPNEFKRLVAEKLDDVGNNYNHVLYAIHGFQITPRYSFNQGHDFLEKYTKHDKNDGYLVIPINWRNVWGMGPPTYDYDRNNCAPRAGKQLAEKFDVFKAPYTTSVVAHSMGNYVFRTFAQNIDSPEQVFQNVFMVAADARSDMFADPFNPDAPRPGELEAEENSLAAGDMYWLDLPLNADETKPNGGYAITNITNNTHVVWNKGDPALAVRELFQVPSVFPGDKYHFRLALGKYGDEAKKIMKLSYFKERVTFHDFTRKVEVSKVDGHGYAWEEDAVNLYKKFKFPKSTTPSSKAENGLLDTSLVTE